MAHVGYKKIIIGEVINRFRETGTTESPKKYTGQSKILITSDHLNLKTLVTNENHHLNISQVTSLFAVQKKICVSRSTIYYALYKENLKSCVAHPKLI